MHTYIYIYTPSYIYNSYMTSFFTLVHISHKFLIGGGLYFGPGIAERVDAAAEAGFPMRFHTMSQGGSQS